MGHDITRQTLWAGFVFLLILAVPPLLAEEVELVAGLDREWGYVGETLRLTVRVVGESTSLSPLLGDLDGLALASGPQQILHSQANQDLSQGIRDFLFDLRPLAPGIARIGSITLEMPDKTLRAEPFTVEILPAGTPAPGAEPHAAFLTLELSQTNVYQGEPLAARVDLFSPEAMAVQETRYLPPRAAGFSLHTLSPPRLSYRRHRHRLYHVHSTEHTLVPLTSGERWIGPAQCEISLLAGRETSAFDRYFGQDKAFADPFFQDRPLGKAFGAIYRRQTLESPLRQVQVHPLPEKGRPVDFQGAVGQFTITASFTPLTLAVGDVGYLDVCLSGKGSWENLTMPPLENFENFTVFAPQVQHAKYLSSANVSQEMRQMLSPTRPGTYRTPQFTFSYFDPWQKSYHAHHWPGVVITVTGEIPALVVTREELPTEPTPSAGKEEKTLNFPTWLVYTLSILGIWGIFYLLARMGAARRRGAYPKPGRG